MSVKGMFRPGMRAYLVPLAAGLALAASAFLPWVVVGTVPMRGFPDMPALWVMGLGLLAATLAILSLITRKNSRHPLLVIGLAALSIMFLSWRVLPRTAGERAATIAQAFSIVEGREPAQQPEALVGSGIYLGLVASVALVTFGLTIVVRRASSPYIINHPDDDV